MSGAADQRLARVLTGAALHRRFNIGGDSLIDKYPAGALAAMTRCDGTLKSKTPACLVHSVRKVRSCVCREDPTHSLISKTSNCMPGTPRSLWFLYFKLSSSSRGTADVRRGFQQH
eukprot:3714877-Rhodomonas_salina.1